MAGAKIAPLLVEIRCEELPPAQVWQLAGEFPRALFAALARAGFVDENADANLSQTLATPRRFAALLPNVAAATAAKTIRRVGPAVAACYDSNGKPAPALLGFMRAVGAKSANDLTQETTKGAPYVVWHGKQAGQNLQSAIGGLLGEVLAGIVAPRLMRWGGNKHKFIRPLRGWLATHGGQTLAPADAVFGVAASPQTRGHPALAPANIAIAKAEDYEKILWQEGKVIIDINKRREKIAQDLQNAVAPEALLSEVAAMCECPTTLEGRIDKEFLSLPAFCAQECLNKHQRAFVGKGADGSYYFVADNIPGKPQEVARGFNAVVRARLRDVAFYIAEDKKLSAAAALQKLEAITHHRLLGSQRLRAERIVAIAGALCELLRVSPQERAAALAAAKICKSDLPTLMIGEYPALEGRMAAEYFGKDDDTRALAACHNDRDWSAPPHLQRAALALVLANRLEQIVGLFGAGEEPSGSKDPHGLRAAAAAVALAQKRAAEGGREVAPLSALLAAAAGAFDAAAIKNYSPRAAANFIIKRELAELREAGMPGDVLNAAGAGEGEYVNRLRNKAAALARFKQAPQAAALIEANKRINNILRKSAAGEGDAAPQPNLFKDKAEGDLWARLQAVVAANQKEDDSEAAYFAALQRAGELKEAIDEFFARVLVNDDNAQTRENRLRLLRGLRAALTPAGDLSKLSG